MAERYLGFQQPGSLYGFSDAGDGSKRVCAFLLSQFSYDLVSSFYLWKFGISFGSFHGFSIFNFRLVLVGCVKDHNRDGIKVTIFIMVRIELLL